jgi:hypothetical protein
MLGFRFEGVGEMLFNQVTIIDLLILFFLAAALIFLLSYHGGFYSGFKEGYAKREKERLETDQRQLERRKGIRI